MSERGSFVTEYIYCQKCLEVAKEVLLRRHKDLCSTVLPSWTEDGVQLPIIAGKIGGSYRGEELYDFAGEFTYQLEEKLCHQLRVAVLAEEGSRIFTIEPDPTHDRERQQFDVEDRLAAEEAAALRTAPDQGDDVWPDIENRTNSKRDIALEALAARRAADHHSAD